MPGNIFGKILQVTTFGESHGPALGAVVDGCPAGIKMSEEDFNQELARRRPGQSVVTTARKEQDKACIISGIFEGRTTGMPIAVLVMNEGQRSQDYDALKHIFRTGHADQTYQDKYGFRDHRGGGRSSGRETIGRVIGGVVARRILPKKTDIFGHVLQIGEVRAKKFSRLLIEKNPLRCADKQAAKDMETYIMMLKEQHDSVGGLVEIRVKYPPKSLGEPVFDKLKADLAKAIMSIGAVTGFSYGAGFETVAMRGTQYVKNKKYFGGMLGGISTGEDIVLHISIKPSVSIGSIAKEGRHDPCIVPRVIPVLEAMVAMTLADHFLRNKSYG